MLAIMRTFGRWGTLLILSLAAMSSAAAEHPQKVKEKDSRVVVTDKSKPVRRELEQTYARMGEAVEKNDAEAVLAFNHPDYTSVDFNGRTNTAADNRARTLQMVSLIRPPIHASWKLGNIDVHGDTAVVTVHQHFDRMQLAAGKLRHIDTRVIQDETWVRTPQGWKRLHVENEHDMLWYVDGKRIEPGKPYDPDAPPYEPKPGAP